MPAPVSGGLTKCLLIAEGLDVSQILSQSTNIDNFFPIFVGEDYRKKERKMNYENEHKV